MFKKSYNSVYGVNNNNFRILFLLLIVVFVFYIFTVSNSQVQPATNCLQATENAPPIYNSTYPLTRPDKSRNFLRYGSLGFFACWQMLSVMLLAIIV